MAVFRLCQPSELRRCIVLVLIGAGTLGIEIPLIVRLLKEQSTLRVNLSNVLTLDYAGALLAALAFPLVLVPQLGWCVPRSCSDCQRSSRRTALYTLALGAEEALLRG